MRIVFLLLVCIGPLYAQWKELDPDGPTVLTTEPDARPAARQSASLWCHSDDIYLLGGQGQDTYLWKYEGETARWLWLSKAPVLPVGFSYWNVRDFFYLFGANHFYQYSPLTREWTSLISSNTTTVLPSYRTHATHWSDPLNNRIFVYGGVNEHQTVLDDLWSYNVEENKWTQHGSVQTPGPFAQASACRVEDQVYLFGGLSVPGSSPTSNSLWNLDLSSLTWQRVDLTDNTQPAARMGHVLFPTPNKDQLILFGGVHGSTVYSDMWSFDLNQQKWNQVKKGSKPSPRFDAATCIDEESAIYIVTGAASVNNNDELHNDVWRYGPLGKQRLLAEFFRIDFNAVQLSSTIGGVCSMLTLILLTIYGLVACVYKCRRRRQRRMQSALPMQKMSDQNKDDLF